MQIKIFTIPVVGGEMIQEEMNKFLRGQKVLQVEQQLVQDGGAAYWSFCVKYLLSQSGAPKSRSSKVDYKEVLDEETFAKIVEACSLDTIRLFRTEDTTAQPKDR